MSSDRDHLAEIKVRLIERIETLAETLLGPRNSAHSTSRRWRFGRHAGSLALEIEGTDRGLWYDHAAGVGGAPLDLIMHALQCRFAEAARWAQGWLGDPASVRRPAPPAARTPQAPKKNTLPLGRRYVAESVAVPGTLGERYLREHRGIAGPLPPEIRFHPRVFWRDRGDDFPALLVVAHEGGVVRRVQAVLLDPVTGKKIADKRAKRTFGQGTSHIPVTFAARVADPTTQIAEGPEDAVTVWAATGCRTCATLGAGSLHKANIAPGGDVLLCGDEGKAGRDAVKRAAEKYGAAGCRVVTAFPTHGAADFNDLLRSHGEDAVRAALRDAQPVRRYSLPAYYPAPSEPLEVALRRQNDTIIANIWDGATRRDLEKEWRRRVEELEADMTPAQKGALARRIKRDLMAACSVSALQMRPRRELVSGAQGTGKTQTYLGAIAAITAPVFVVTRLPDHRMAEQAARDYATVGGPDSMPHMIVRGRSAPDPLTKAEGTPMCPRHEVADRAALRGVNVRKVICQNCPLGDECGTNRQYAEIAEIEAGGRGLFIDTHNYGFLPSPAPPPDVLVIDESSMDAAIAPVIELTPAEILDAAPFHGHDLDRSIAVNTVLRTIHDAVQTPAPLAALRGVGVTIEALREARALLGTATQLGSVPIDGTMTDAEIEAALDQLPRGHGKVLALLAMLIREYHMPRTTLNGMQFYSGRKVQHDGKERVAALLRVHSLKPLHGISRRTQVLLTDGTGNIDIVRRILGHQLGHIHTPVERDAFVTGTRGKCYSRQSVAGHDRKGRPLRPEAAKQLRDDLATVAGRMPGPRLVIAPKPAKEALVPHLLEYETTHYGAERGRNDWKNCQSGLIIGCISVSVEAVENITRALYADDPEPLISCDCNIPPDWPYQQWPFYATRMRRMRNGILQAVEVPVHPDPRAQAVLEQIREARVLQAGDRLRPVFNHRQLTFANDLVLDITYDRVLTHAELVAGGTRLDLAFAEGGILPLTGWALHALYPGRFTSEKAAELVLEREKANYPHCSNKMFLFEGRGHFAFRVAGRPGGPARVLVDLRQHLDPRLAVELVFGSLDLFEPIAGVQVPPATPPGRPSEPIPLRPSASASARAGSAPPAP